MTRYRILSLGQPLTSWQATYDLALQSAVEAGSGRRDPESGRVELARGVQVQLSDGDAPLRGDIALWADALEIIRQHREMARTFADQQVGLHAHDIPAQARWVLIRRRIVQIMEAAARDARR